MMDTLLSIKIIYTAKQSFICKIMTLQEGRGKPGYKHNLDYKITFSTKLS